MILRLHLRSFAWFMSHLSTYLQVCVACVPEMSKLWSTVFRAAGALGSQGLLYIIISLLETLYECRLLEQWEDLNVFPQLIINNSSPVELLSGQGWTGSDAKLQIFVELWNWSSCLFLTPACGGRLFGQEMPIKFYQFNEIDFYISIN